MIWRHSICKADQVFFKSRGLIFSISCIDIVIY